MTPQVDHFVNPAAQNTEDIHARIQTADSDRLEPVTKLED